MFIFINPWTSYDKEDIKVISENITENSGIILPWLVSIITIVTVGLWLWICCNDFLFSVALVPMCILTFFVIIFDIIYVLENPV